MSTEARGATRPAVVALARILWGQATSRPRHPAWTDADGTLTRRDLFRAVRARARALPPGPVVVAGASGRETAVASLAGLLARRPVRVVPARAGEAALRAARSVGGRGIAFFTSGSTGPARPSTARWSVLAAAQATGTLGLLPLPRHPVVASLAPVDHGHGWSALLLTLLTGGHFVDCAGRPDLVPGRVDVLTGVPLHLHEYADTGRPSTQIGLLLSGSDRLVDAEKLERVLGAPLYDAYGATETGTVCLATPVDRRRSPGTVGRPLPFVRVREVDGVLEVRSPMLGDGVFRGDRGRVEDGLVHVTGRADDRVVTGGVTSDPEAVRRWLLRQPGVEAVRLTPRDDARFGARTVAEVTASTPLDPAALRLALAAELGAASAPAEVIVVD